MSRPLERCFKILELLAASPEGRSLSSLAADIDMPASAAHRLLAELAEFGYVRQEREQGEYLMTIKLAALGLSFLSSSGVVDVAQPALDALAESSGELVRLAVIDGESLVFVAKAQGARRGLRYDPDMGISVRLSCSAAGHAWLATLTDEQALGLVMKQGFGTPEEFGPKAPVTVNALRNQLRATRQRGFSMISDMYAPAMSSMSAAVRPRGGSAIGVVTIAGPLVRLTEDRMALLGPLLVEAADEVAAASGASTLFKRPVLVQDRKDKPAAAAITEPARGRAKHA